MIVKWSPLPVRSAGEAHDNLYFGLKAKEWGHLVQKSVEFECANLVQSTESWYTCCVSDRLPCAARLLNRSSSPSGASRQSQTSDLTRLPECSAWKKNFTYVDTFLLTWQVSRVSDEGVAVRMGGARLGQRSARAPTIFSSADVAALRVEPCSGEAAACLFLPPLRRTIDPGDDPGVYRTAMCMFLPAVLPAMSLASSFSRAAVERA